jgi:hypothetical protein
MSEEVAAATELLGAGGVRSRPDTSTPVFELGRLPYELRVKVVNAAAAEYQSVRTRRASLRRVSKEFNAVVDPSFWFVSPRIPGDAPR